MHVICIAKTAVGVNAYFRIKLYDSNALGPFLRVIFELTSPI
jgi:hypothetical protein